MMYMLPDFGRAASMSAVIAEGPVTLAGRIP